MSFGYMNISKYRNKVFVIGNDFLTKSMFRERGFIVCNNILNSDFVVFTGGEDVDPSFYGEEKHQQTYSNITRDKTEEKIFKYCKDDLHLPMVGICRGSQFLTVMSGGKLWQHVDNHSGRGNHDAILVKTGDIIKVTSTHHQMMRPPEGAEILMIAQESTIKEHMIGKNSMSRRRIVRPDKDEDDIEAIWVPETKSLCVQFHPEYNTATKECKDMFFEMLYEKILSNDDFYPDNTEAPDKEFVTTGVKKVIKTETNVENV